MQPEEVIFACNGCQTILSVPKNLLGFEDFCPQCGEIIKAGTDDIIEDSRALSEILQGQSEAYVQEDSEVVGAKSGGVKFSKSLITSKEESAVQEKKTFSLKSRRAIDKSGKQVFFGADKEQELKQTQADPNKSAQVLPKKVSNEQLGKKSTTKELGSEKNAITDIIYFSCNFCRSKMVVSAEFAGRRDACPECGEEIVAPEANSSTSRKSDSVFISLESKTEQKKDHKAKNAIAASLAASTASTASESKTLPPIKLEQTAKVTPQPSAEIVEKPAATSAQNASTAKSSTAKADTSDIAAGSSSGQTQALAATGESLPTKALAPKTSPAQTPKAFATKTSPAQTPKAFAGSLSKQSPNEVPNNAPNKAPNEAPKETAKAAEKVSENQTKSDSSQTKPFFPKNIFPKLGVNTPTKDAAEASKNVESIEGKKAVLDKQDKLDENSQSSESVKPAVASSAGAFKTMADLPKKSAQGLSEKFSKKEEEAKDKNSAKGDAKGVAKGDVKSSADKKSGKDTKEADKKDNKKERVSFWQSLFVGKNKDKIAKDKIAKDAEQKADGDLEKKADGNLAVKDKQKEIKADVKKGEGKKLFGKSSSFSKTKEEKSEVKRAENKGVKDEGKKEKTSFGKRENFQAKIFKAADDEKKVKAKPSFELLSSDKGEDSPITVLAKIGLCCLILMIFIFVAIFASYLSRNSFLRLGADGQEKYFSNSIVLGEHSDDEAKLPKVAKQKSNRVSKNEISEKAAEQVIEKREVEKSVKIADYEDTEEVEEKDLAKKIKIEEAKKVEDEKVEDELVTQKDDIEDISDEDFQEIADAFGMESVAKSDDKSKKELANDAVEIESILDSGKNEFVDASTIKNVLYEKSTDDPYEATEGFLKANNWSERVKYVLSPQEVTPLAKTFYKKFADEPMDFKKLLKIGEIDFEDTDQKSISFEVVLAGSNRSVYVPIITTVMGAKVDWLAFVESRYDLLNAFARGKQDIQSVFRTRLARISPEFADKNIPNPENKHLFFVVSLDSQDTDIKTAYVDKETTLGKEIARRVEWEREYFWTLDFERSDVKLSDGKNLLKIKGLAADSWNLTDMLNYMRKRNYTKR